MIEASYQWPFWWGGLAIGLVSIFLLVFTGKFLSVTRGYASVCSIFSKRPYFQRPDLGGKFGFRTMFTIGLVLGGFFATFSAGGYHPNFDLGEFESIWGTSLAIKASVLIVGGFLWGYGSRMAKGCTSGNSISGLSKGNPASLVVTICFILAGAIVTHILEYVIK